MSARRLAISQPKDFKLSADAKRKINAWVKKYPKGRQRSALIPALWIAQADAGGWLPEAISSISPSSRKLASGSHPPASA